MRKMLMIIAFAALGLGCGKKDEGTPTDKTVSGDPAAAAVSADKTPVDKAPEAATPATPEPAAKEPDLPTQPDFEDEAKAEITDKNLEKELQKIENDLGE